MKSFFKRHFLLVAIIVISLALRLFRIDVLTSFQGDQGRDLLAVRNIIVNHDPTLLGPPSTFGPFQGPLYYYLLTPGLFFSRLNPIGGLLTAVFFNISGLVILYFFTKIFFGRKAAIVASIFYAASPLTIEIGRTLLNAYFGIPFFMIGLWVLIDIVVYKKIEAKYIALLGFISGILIQLHYNFAPFFLFGLLVPLMHRHIKKIKFYSYYLALFIFASFPQILFELRHEFLSTNLLFKSLETGHAVGSFSYSYILFFFSTIGFLFGWENVWYGIIVFAILIFGLINLRKKFDSDKSRVLKLLVSYFVFFIIVAVLSRVKIDFPAYHYYMSIFPLLFIFSGIIWSKQKKALQITTVIIFVTISFVNLNLFRDHGFTMVENWNMRKQRHIAKIVASDAKDKKNWNIASVVDGDTQGYPFRYHVASFGVDTFMGIEEYPQSNILYLATRDEKEKVFDYAVWEISSLKPFAITKEWRVGKEFNIYRIERND